MVALGVVQKATTGMRTAALVLSGAGGLYDTCGMATAVSPPLTSLPTIVTPAAQPLTCGLAQIAWIPGHVMNLLWLTVPEGLLPVTTHLHTSQQTQLAVSASFLTAAARSVSRVQGWPVPGALKHAVQRFTMNARHIFFCGEEGSRRMCSTM